MNIVARGIAALLALTLIFVADARAASIPPESPLRIAVGGDSISEPCITSSGWCGELRGLLAKQGVVAEFSALASGGKRCKWIAERIVAFLEEVHPDILLLNCGTNDDPNEYCYGEPCTTWSWRIIVEAARTRDINVGVAFIGYTDPDDPKVIGARPRLERENDLLYSQISRFQTVWDLALANFQVVPGDPDYLPDGVHPISPVGARVYAEIWHGAVASRSWAPAGWTPLGYTSCGMYGRRTGYPVPQYTPCQK